MVLISGLISAETTGDTIQDTHYTAIVNKISKNSFFVYKYHTAAVVPKFHIKKNGVKSQYSRMQCLNQRKKQNADASEPRVLQSFSILPHWSYHMLQFQGSRKKGLFLVDSPLRRGKGLSTKVKSFSIRSLGKGGGLKALVTCPLQKNFSLRLPLYYML